MAETTIRDADLLRFFVHGRSTPLTNPYPFKKMPNLRECRISYQRLRKQLRCSEVSMMIVPHSAWFYVFCVLMTRKIVRDREKRSKHTRQSRSSFDNSQTLSLNQSMLNQEEGRTYRMLVDAEIKLLQIIDNSLSLIRSDSCMALQTSTIPLPPPSAPLSPRREQI